MKKYESVYVERKQRKENKYEPKKITFDSIYCEDIEYCLDYIQQSFDDKGYVLLGSLCAQGCLDLLYSYDYDDLQEYGWDKNFFDADDLYVRKSKRGFYYVELEAPMKMVL